MTLYDSGFRPFYRRFVAVELNDTMKKEIADFPNADTADYALVYGFVDKEQRLTFEVIAAAKKDEEGIIMAPANLETRVSFSPDVIMNQKAVFFDDTTPLEERFKSKLNQIKAGTIAGSVEFTRTMDFLDDLRDKLYIDVIQTYLVSKKSGTEKVSARIIGYRNQYIVAVLQDSPKKNYGVKKDDIIYIKVTSYNKNACIAFSDLNPEKIVEYAEYENGETLRKAIKTFKESKEQNDFINMLYVLSESLVWVPYATVNGKQLSPVPDVFTNSDESYIPVFTSMEAMKEYGSKMNRIKQHVLDVVSVAKTNPRLNGFVVDPFTDSMVFGTASYDTLIKAIGDPGTKNYMGKIEGIDL